MNTEFETETETEIEIENENEFHASQVLESSSITSIGQTHHHQDDDAVLLASTCPKKRAGRKIFKETRHPVYRGIRRRNKNKWVCELREPNKKTRIWLGTYPTAEMAARAHDVAALALRGKEACLNFADSAWQLPTPVSTDPIDIRKAAAEAAEAFRPRAEAEVGDCVGAAEGSLNNEGSSGFVQDGEELFCMDYNNGWLEGPLLSPPYSAGTESYVNWEDGESDGYVTLWSYST